MSLPGQPGSVVPPGEDWVPRELSAIRHEQREAVASIAASFKTTVAELQDLIAAVLTTATDQAGLSNYEITTTSTVRASVSFTVPDGFTRAQVMCVAAAMGYNGSGGDDYLYVQAVVQGVNGGELYSAARNGYGVGLSVPEFRSLTGLTAGQTITVGVATRTGFSSWAAIGSNSATIDCQVVFLR